MDFKNVFDNLKTEILSLIKERFGKESDAIKGDVTQYLDNSKGKIEKWGVLLAKGDITKAELEILLQSQKELMLLHGLHKAGIAK
ncbi:MAG: hypothetical protein ACPGQR_09430, partial [Marinirhabdus sp.]